MAKRSMSALSRLLGRGSRTRAEDGQEEEDKNKPMEGDGAVDPNEEEDAAEDQDTEDGAAEPGEDEDEDMAEGEDGEEDAGKAKGKGGAHGVRASADFRKGRDTGVAAERARWASVFGNKAVQGREATAAALLAAGNASAREITAMLPTLPQGGASAATGLADRMRQTQTRNPLGAGGPADGGRRASLADRMKAMTAKS